MTALPAASAFTGASVTEGQFKTALTDFRAALFEMLGDNAGGGIKAGANFLGSVYLNDSANASMTLGLTINQGGADDEALALKSSDVAHGMTAITETDTYLRLQKASAVNGGAIVQALSAGTLGLSLIGDHTTDDTTKSTAGEGAVNIRGRVKSGTSITGVGANANILAVKNNGNARFILDGDGDSHQDVGTAWTNFDSFDDVRLLTALSAAVSPKHDPLRHAFRRLVEKYRVPLAKARLVTFNKNGHHFINWSRTNMAMIGTLRQLADRLMQVEAQLGLPGAPAGLLALEMPAGRARRGRVKTTRRRKA